MNKNPIFCFVHALACILCCSSASAAADTPKAPLPESAFEQLVDDFVFGTLALSPTTATSFGYHVHHGASLDDVLDDFSPGGLAASRDLLHEMDVRIAKLDAASLDAEQRADIDIMRNAIGAARLDLDEI